MSSDTTIQLSLIAIVGTVITSLFALLRANTRALNKVASSSTKVAIATTKSAKEASERNGHLAEHLTRVAELVSQGNEITGKIVDRLNASAVIAAEDRDVLTSHPTQEVREQHVTAQVVEKAIIKDNK